MTDRVDYACQVCRNFADNGIPRSYPTAEEPWHPDCYIHQARVADAGPKRFVVYRTSERDEDAKRAPCDGAVLAPVVVDGRTRTAWTMSFDSLGQLLAWIKTLNTAHKPNEVVVCATSAVLGNGTEEDTPMIEIYDSYRE